MPFDPFFSSANKHHFVKSERYEVEVKPEVDRILKLPNHERAAIVSALRVKISKREATMSERLVHDKLSFIYARKHAAIQRRQHWKREKKLREKGKAFFGGYNTT